ncbi:MAG: bifunctional phosphopantothenoylcysteine decarboxylase/phosphopantothenate--cysteine ligase CoaBC [Actinomycetes bacterium]
MSQQPLGVSREVVLGIGGGIAAYKSCDLLRRLKDHGFLVSVIPTRSSLNFVGSATWEALSGRPVQTDLWNNVHEVPHISMAKKADAIVIAPATADLIARIACGRADDLLTNVVIASNAPIILVPAMHTEMWLNEATVANVEALRKRGVIIIDPAVGDLSSGDSGVGRYPETSEIIDVVENTFNRKADLIGKKVLVSAGGTREAIDPVRFIGNLSSGKQGIAVALDAAARGAIVTLVIANAPEISIEDVEVIHVVTADQMLAALDANFDSSDVVVMTAAVADVKPKSSASEKISKSDLTSIELLHNPDIIGTLASRKRDQVLIGFAAQTGVDRLSKAHEKLVAKHLDFLYMNDVSNGAIFGSDETEGVIIGSSVEDLDIPMTSKATLARKLLSLAIDKLG